MMMGLIHKITVFLSKQYYQKKDWKSEFYKDCKNGTLDNLLLLIRKIITSFDNLSDDVDCIVNLSTYSSYMSFCDELLSLKFHNDTREGAPMCRYIFGENNIVDIMPVESTAIGESNRWYKPGFSFRKAYEIAAGKTIYLLSVGYYIATKLEALFSRGGKDYRGASDFEDIVYVSNSCKDLYQSVS